MIHYSLIHLPKMVLFCFGVFFCLFFFSQTATFIPNHKFMTISLAQQQTRTWDRSHELWAASQNTTEILLQGLLSKLVCGLDTSVKTLFFCKTNSGINTSHQDFVLMAGLWDRTGWALWALLSDSVCHQDSKIPSSWIMYTHLPWTGHFPGGTNKDSWQINKTV